MREQKALGLSVVVLTVVLLSGAVRGEAPKIAWRTDINDAWRSTKEDERLLLLYVKTDGCVYCDRMERECYGDPQIAQVVATSYVPAALHASKQPGLTQKMGIQAFPTTVIIDSKGQVVDSVQGYVPKSRLLSWLKKRAGKKSGEPKGEGGEPEGQSAGQR